MMFDLSKEELAIDEIDEEIRALENRITRLRLERNALIPIGHLPFDILEKVFLIARRQVVPIIHLSWVSHAWRTLALERKTLWTMIDNSNLQWTSLHFERSYPAPLVVHFKEPFNNENLFLKIMQRLPQIKALILPLVD